MTLRRRKSGCRLRSDESGSERRRSRWFDSLPGRRVCFDGGGLPSVIRRLGSDIPSRRFLAGRTDEPCLRGRCHIFSRAGLAAWRVPHDCTDAQTIPISQGGGPMAQSLCTKVEEGLRPAEKPRSRLLEVRRSARNMLPVDRELLSQSGRSSYLPVRVMRIDPAGKLALISLLRGEADSLVANRLWVELGKLRDVEAVQTAQSTPRWVAMCKGMRVSSDPESRFAPRRRDPGGPLKSTGMMGRCRI